MAALVFFSSQFNKSELFVKGVLAFVTFVFGPPILILKVAPAVTASAVAKFIVELSHGLHF